MSNRIPHDWAPEIQKAVAPVLVYRMMERAEYQLRGARVCSTLAEGPWLHAQTLGQALGITIEKMRERDPFVKAYERDAEIEIHPVFTLNLLEQLAFPEVSRG